VLPLRRTLYLLLTFPLGLTWFIVLVVGVSTGVGMAVIGVGIVILVAMLWATRVMADVERVALRALVGVDIPRNYRERQDAGVIATIRLRLGDPQTWKDLVYLVAQFPLGIVWLVVVLTVWGLALGFLFAPVWFWSLPDGIQLGLFTIDSLPEAIAVVPLGALLTWIAWRGGDALGRLHGAWAQLLLASSPDPELEARVDEMRSGQARIIEAADAARRRIERDLHDGAQQRLVALSLKLGMARKRLETEGSAASRLVAEAHEESKLALVELRDLARGIHPAILTERGLGPAIEELASRSTVPVFVEELPDTRLPAAAEAAAYFVVAECLANVAKYAGAGEASVRARREVGRVVVEVVDDGVGGADPAAGSGLRGLADRVEALGGLLTVGSVAGAGTTVRAEIPLATVVASVAD
jgi:signal transduction histidine kinase